jgi:mannosyltransferase OCH1-like enzyme
VSRLQSDKKATTEQNVSMRIPKIIHQVWIGPKEPPLKWMETWQQKYPDWEYILWDNEKVFNRKWKNQWIIDHYVNRYNNEVKGRYIDGRDLFISAQGAEFKGDKATYFAWHILADILRYEILYEYGGRIPGADSECIRRYERPFHNNSDLYIVNTGYLYTEQRKALEAKEKLEGIDKIRYERYHPMNASPVMACSKGHWFLEKIIDELSKLKIEDLGEAVDTTGNVFMGKMLMKYNPERTEIKLKDLKDSHHHAGTTKSSYHRGRYKDLDLVYVTKDSPVLKYAVRSATQNIEHRNVVIVGKKPKWSKGIVHIPYKEKHRGEGKEKRNVVDKILKACKDKRVSENFLLMNDDFFFTKAYEPQVCIRGRLRDIYRKGKGKGYPTFYRKQQADTLTLLGKYAKDYETHCPLEINKKQFLNLAKLYDIKNKYLTRTLYGNYYQLKGETIVDPKTSTWRGKDVFSTNDRIEQTKTFRNYIKRKFKDKSKYEK